MEFFQIRVTPYAVNLFAKLDREKAYCKSYVQSKKIKHYTDLVKTAKAKQSNAYKAPGYSSGCFGMSDTVTSDLAATPKFKASEQNINDFVVVAFLEDGMCIATVTTWDADDSEFEGLYMISSGENQYEWTAKDDPRCEGKVFVSKDRVLLAMSNPTMKSGSSRCQRDRFHFPQIEINNAKELYTAWRIKEIARKERKRKH